MAQAILSGDPPINITLRRSPQARRLTLRVSRLDGRVTLSMPAWTPESEALVFARQKEDWLRQALADQGPRQVPAPGLVFPLEGRSLTISPANGRAVRVDGDRLLVPGPDERMPVRLAAFVKLIARDRLAAASDSHARALGRMHSGMSLRDTRSRWGSCAPDGRLMYSWRLAMAPTEVLDYVAAHEVAHLAEMNHSPAFWAVVAQLTPDFAIPRAWLKRNGASLQRWHFGG